ncbi:hypothetical protein P3T25_009566, partial [Paraburkholderia sp. GAS32]
SESWAVSTVNQWTQLALLSIRALCADKFALTFVERQKPALDGPTFIHLAP